MIPELGHFALIVALCVALVQGTLPLIGAHRRQPGWIALARPAARAQALLMAVAFDKLTVSSGVPQDPKRYDVFVTPTPAGRNGWQQN